MFAVERSVRLTVHVRAVSPEACPALVLNADFRPLSYYPLSIWCWQDAIKAVFLDRVNIVSLYDMTVRSPSFEMRLPSVVSLKNYVKPSRFPAFTRFNVFLRDRFTCQYCGEREELTFDHVVPPVQAAICARATCCPPPPGCGRRPCRFSPPSTTSTKTGACSRPIICTRAGWIISIGTASWSRDYAGGLTPPRSRLLRNPFLVARQASGGFDAAKPMPRVIS
jgi:hypothetical protein